MRTAVDTSVLLDVFSNSPRYVRASRQALSSAISEGSLVACDVVWAEARAHFAARDRFEEAMATLGVVFDPCDAESAALAGELWRSYRQGGGGRNRLIPDFLVGAHAATRSDRLLTRDRGFTRRYFADLVVLEP